MCSLRQPRRYGETEAREAIAASLSWAEAVRRLGYCSTGNGTSTLKKYARIWGISIDHFDPNAARLKGLAAREKPLEEILVENSTYRNRQNLKNRLYREKLKKPNCELCGQGQIWRGQVISLILDHVNGVRDDNRLENLRIVCPNCAATLPTHCGRNAALDRSPRSCQRCGTEFFPKYESHRYCSRECGQRWDRSDPTHGDKTTYGVPQPERRLVARPPMAVLQRELAESNYEAVGRKYGVSGNAIRKWIKFYEHEAERKRWMDGGAEAA